MVIGPRPSQWSKPLLVAPCAAIRVLIYLFMGLFIYFRVTASPASHTDRHFNWKLSGILGSGKAPFCGALSQMSEMGARRLCPVIAWSAYQHHPILAYSLTCQMEGVERGGWWEWVMWQASLNGCELQAEGISITCQIAVVAVRT